MLRFELLGHAEVSVDGRALAFPTRKAFALLAYLVIEGGQIPRERLLLLLWPESGRGTLRTALRYLRQALDAAPGGSDRYLRVEGDAIGFDFEAPHGLDLAAVAAAAADPDTDPEPALALARGPLLDGLTLPDAPDFDLWLHQQRLLVEAQVGALHERRVARLAAHHAWEAAIAAARDWLARDPLDERAHRRLIELHALAGHRAAALEAYARCRKVLEDELGLAPDPETRALARRIRETPPDAPPRSVPATPEPPFVGRERELAGLAAALEQARAGPPGLVTLEGEAGIGKSRLAREWLDALAFRRVEVLRGRAYESGGRLPYQPLVAALRPRLEAENAPDDLLDDTWLAELARLFPELRERYPDLPPPRDGEERLAPTLLPEALAQLLLALAARRPLLLFIDDAQWADVATLDALRHAVRSFEERSAPALFLVALRDEYLGSGTPLGRWLLEVGDEGRLRRIRVGPISVDETRALVDRVAGEAAPTLAAWLHEASAGSPFVITETLAALEGQPLGVLGTEQLATTVPAGLRRLLERRTERLPDGARALLVAAAVIGRPATAGMLARVAGVELDRALDDLELLLARRLLREEPGRARPYDTAHDRLRVVIYEAAGSARRQLYHQRALETLAEQPAGAIDPAELAYHAIGAGRPDEALSRSIEAGGEALRLFAIPDAIAHLDRARALLGQRGPERETGPLGELFLPLGRALELAERPEEAGGVYEELLARAGAVGDAVLEGAALNRLANLAAQHAYDLDGAQRYLSRALDAAERGADPRGVAEAEWNLAQLGIFRFDLPLALDHAARALERARAQGWRELEARSLNTLAFAESGVAAWARAERHAAEAARLDAALGNREVEADSLCAVSRARLNLGLAREALAAAREAHRITTEIGAPWGLAVSGFHLALALLESDALDEALEVARAGLSAAMTVRDFAPLPILTGVTLGLVHRALGDLEAARAEHERALEIGRSRPERPLLRLSAEALCVDLAQTGDWPAALETAREARDAPDHTLLHGGLWRWWLVRALLEGDDWPAAEDEIATLADRAAISPRYAIPYHLARAWRAVRETDDPVAELEAAARVARELGLPGAGREIEAERARLGAG